MSTESSVQEDLALSDPFLQFDATNWLLDESFIELENVNFTVHEARPLSGHPNQSSVGLSSIKQSDKPPTVLDLQRMWFLQVRRRFENFHDDGEERERSAITTQRSDIDEDFHTHMVEDLRPLLPSEPLPSVDQLVCDGLRMNALSNDCLRTFAFTSSSPALMSHYLSYMLQPSDRALATLCLSC